MGYGLYVLSSVHRAFWPPYRDDALSRIARDTSFGVSGPHDFTVRNEPFVGTSKGHAATRRGHRSPPRVS